MLAVSSACAVRAVARGLDVSHSLLLKGFLFEKNQPHGSRHAAASFCALLALTRDTFPLLFYPLVLDDHSLMLSEQRATLCL